MKLPENKNERVMVFVLSGIGVAAVIFAIAQLAIAPFLSAKQKLKSALETKQATLENAEKDLKFVPAIKAEFDSITAQLDTTIANNVLHPILGSYLVGVTEALETQARALYIKLDEIQEIGIRDPPRPSTKKGAATPILFKSYSVQISAQASFDQATALIKKLEELNPYLCVSDIRITGQPDAPERHRLTIRIEWPIEAEADKGQSAITDRGDGV